jgi:hypothetical protein
MLDRPGSDQSGQLIHDTRMGINKTRTDMRKDPTDNVDTDVNTGQLKKNTRKLKQFLSGEYKPYRYDHNNKRKEILQKQKSN